MSCDVLIVAYGQREAEALARKAASGETVLLHLKEIERSLPGITNKSRFDYLSKKDVKEIYAKAMELTRNWYKFEPWFEKALEFDGVSVGLLSEHGLAHIFRDLIQSAVAVVNAIEREKPGTVVANSRGTGCAVAKTAMQKFNHVELVDILPGDCSL